MRKTDRASCPENRWMYTRRGARLLREIARAWERLHGRDVFQWRNKAVENPWFSDGMQRALARALDANVYNEVWGYDLDTQVEAIEASLRP